jgi:hypothetical protein
MLILRMSKNNLNSNTLKSSFLLFYLLFIPFTSVNAGGGGTTTTTNTGNSTIGNTTTGASTATSGSNTSGNNTVTTNYAAPRIPVSPAIAPANLPTAPCMGASSVGISGALFGFSSGSSWMSEECMTLEMVRSFEQAGQDKDAMAVRCTSKYAAAAPSCIKLLKDKLEINQKINRKMTDNDDDYDYIRQLF